ncbi:tryptophan synthase beta subunit-like PLP-dependent enzyme [Aspergillus venezuelensis]
MITEAEKRGDLKPDMTVVEATGGSTGSSLAFICAVKGYNFHVVSSDVFAAEKIKTMRAFGTDVDLVHVPGGKITKELFPEMMRRASAKVESDLSMHYYTNQSKNSDALPGYESLGLELVEQFPGGIDVFCGAAGSAGMLMGVASVLKEKRESCRVGACFFACCYAGLDGHPWG